MPTYKITDPQTGKTLALTGDSPPTEQELEEIFSQTGINAPQEQAEPERGLFGQVLEKPKNPQSPEQSFEQDKEGIQDVSIDVASAIYGLPAVGRLGAKLANGLPAVGRLGAKLAIGSARNLAGGSKAVMQTVKAIPGMIRQGGASGVLESIGIQPRTLERIAGKENPIEAGEQLAARLVGEDAVGNTISTTFKKARALKNKFGEAVGSSLKAIKDANKNLGVYPELADPLKVESNHMLKPIIDEANALRDSGYPLDKKASRYYRAMYNSLSTAAEKAKGFLTLDDVGAEMKKVGKLFQKVAPGSEDERIVENLYHTLANTRDSMVNAIAEAAGNPALAESLQNANKGFSLYTRILPDIRRSAAKAATGGFLRPPMKAAVRAIGTPMARSAVKVGGWLGKDAERVVVR